MKKEKFLKLFKKNKKYITGRIDEYVIYTGNKNIKINTNEVDQYIIDLNEINREDFIEKYLKDEKIDDVYNEIIEVRKVVNYIFLDGSILKLMDCGTIGGEQLYEVDSKSEECFAGEFNKFNSQVINFGYDCIETYDRSIIVNNIIKIEDIEMFDFFPTKESIIETLLTGSLDDIEGMMETLKSFTYYLEDYMNEVEEIESSHK
jgi:hypothetical protein